MDKNDWRFNRVVVGIDGSAGAKRALSWAIDLAKRTGAEILAVHVGQAPVRSMATYGFAVAMPVPDWQDEVRGELEEEWCLPLRRAGVHYRTVFEEGVPGRELVAIADREGAGMIVTGCHGYGLVKETLFGSVSHYVVQHSELPVVVVPPERRARVTAAHPEPAGELVPMPAAGVPT